MQASSLVVEEDFQDVIKCAWGRVLLPNKLFTLETIIIVNKNIGEKHCSTEIILFVDECAIGHQDSATQFILIMLTKLKFNLVLS